jgi:hypothetical protein
MGSLLFIKDLRFKEISEKRSIFYNIRFKGHLKVQERSGFGFVINRTPGAGSVIQDYGSTTQIISMAVMYKYLM